MLIEYLRRKCNACQWWTSCPVLSQTRRLVDRVSLPFYERVWVLRRLVHCLFFVLLCTMRCSNKTELYGTHFHPDHFEFWAWLLVWVRSAHCNLPKDIVDPVNRIWSQNFMVATRLFWHNAPFVEGTVNCYCYLFGFFVQFT